MAQKIYHEYLSEIFQFIHATDAVRMTPQCCIESSADAATLPASREYEGAQVIGCVIRQPCVVLKPKDLARLELFDQLFTGTIAFFLVIIAESTEYTQISTQRRSPYMSFSRWHRSQLAVNIYLRKGGHSACEVCLTIGIETDWVLFWPKITMLARLSSL